MAIALALSLPIAAPAQIPSGDARCRNGLAKGVEKLGKTLLRAQERCHRLRAVALLPLGVDCNDPAQSPFPTTLERAADKLEALTLRRCAHADAPAALG